MEKTRDHPVRLAYQPPASSSFLSEQTSHQQQANGTFLSEQISTSHQPPAQRTGCLQDQHYFGRWQRLPPPFRAPKVTRPVWSLPRSVLPIGGDGPRPIRLSYQPSVCSTFLSEQTSHQPPAKRRLSVAVESTLPGHPGCAPHAKRTRITEPAARRWS
jgi:hypothetical protein